MLEDLAQLLGVERTTLDLELAGLEEAAGIEGCGAAARFVDLAAMIRFLDYRAALSGRDLGKDADREALAELVRLAGKLEQVAAERDLLVREGRELRRVIHKTVVDNVELTARVNELSLLRMRQRSSTAPDRPSWYRRLWAFLVGLVNRPGAGDNRSRRAA